MEYGWRVRVSGNALIENHPKGFYVCHMPGSPKSFRAFLLSCIFDAGCSPALRGSSLMAGYPVEQEEMKEKVRKTTWERKLTKTEI